MVNNNTKVFRVLRFLKKENTSIRILFVKEWLVERLVQLVPRDCKAEVASSKNE